MAKNFGIIKAPDGFYIGSILKTGMLSADSRKITDDEIAFMFEDMMRRHKAETGKSVKSFFHKHVPVMIVKVDPTLEECGIMTPRMKAMLEAKARQQAMTKAQRQPKGLRLAVPK
jgi:hypothetical protein